MSNKEKIFDEIRKEMKLNGSWRDVAHFSCFADGVFTYEIIQGNIHTELNIISDDMFFSTENPIELMRKKEITYFEHSVYIFNNGEELKKIGSKKYVAYENIDFN